jgi:hypothetical protein
MSIGLTVTMVIGFAGVRGCGGTNQPGQQEAGPDVTVATVGDFKISEQNLAALAQGLITRQTQGRAVTADDMFNAYANIVSAQVFDGFSSLVAKKEAVTITDKDVLDAAQKQMDMEIVQLKQQFGAKTDADLSSVIQSMTPEHLTLDAFRKKQLEDITKGLQDPIKRQSMLAEASPQVVKDVLAARSKPNDDTLKASFITITAQRILFKGNDIQKQVADEQDEVKKGATFESMMDKYSKADTTKGKKEHDMTVVLTQFQLLNPSYAPLLKLKVGDVSDALLTPEGTVIYKIQKVDHNVPKDFDKQKSAEGAVYAQQMGDIKYQADLDEVKKSVVINWSSLGWKSAYEYQDQLSSATMSTADKSKAIEAAFSDSKQAATDKSDPVANKVAGLTMYVTVRELIKDAGKDGAAKYGADHIAAIKNIEDSAATPALFIELADACAAAKDATGVAEALNQAASMNTNYDAPGAETNKEIANALAADGAGLTQAQKQPVVDALALWVKTKAEQDKALADQKKQEEANTAAQKKQFEQAQKDAKKNGSGPTTGPKTGPTTGKTPPTAPPSSPPTAPPAKKP